MISPGCNSSVIAYSVFNYPAGVVLTSDLNVLMLVTMIVTIVVVIVCVSIFVSQKQYYDRLKVRPTFLVMMTATGVFCQVAAGPMSSISEEFFDSYPCWLRLFLMVNVPTLIGSSLVIKMMIFHFMSNLSRMAVRRHKDLVAGDGSTRGWVSMACGAVKTGFLSFFRPIEDSADTLIALKFLVSVPGQVTIAFVVWLPYLLIVILVALIIPEYRNGCTGCRLFPNVFIIFAISALGFFIFGVLIYMTIRHEADYWNLGKEVGLSFAMLFISAIGFFLAFLASNNFQVMQTCGFMLAIIPQTIYPVVTAYKVEGRRKVRKHRPRVLKPNTNGELVPATSVGPTDAGMSEYRSSQNVRLTLEQVMGNEDLYQAFEHHLTSELAVESLLFLKDVRAWKASFENNPQKDAIAKSIFRNYVQPGAVLEINISSKMRNDLTEVVESNPGSIPSSAFDSAVKDITFLVQKGPLERFSHTNKCIELAEQMGLKGEA